MVASTRYMSRDAGYGPAVLITALILATPIPWRRRCVALCWGIPLVHGFAALQFALTLLLIGTQSGVSLYVLSPFWHKALAVSVAISQNRTTWLVAPIPIWILVSFRRSDWLAILGTAAAVAARDQQVSDASPSA